MGELVGENFLAYNPVTAEYTVQGRSMQIGLGMFIEMMQCAVQQHRHNSRFSPHL